MPSNYYVQPGGSIFAGVLASAEKAMADLWAKLPPPPDWAGQIHRRKHGHKAGRRRREPSPQTRSHVAFFGAASRPAVGRPLQSVSGAVCGQLPEPLL